MHFSPLLVIFALVVKIHAIDVYRYRARLCDSNTKWVWTDVLPNACLEVGTQPVGEYGVNSFEITAVPTDWHIDFAVYAW